MMGFTIQKQCIFECRFEKICCKKSIFFVTTNNTKSIQKFNTFTQLFVFIFLKVSLRLYILKARSKFSLIVWVIRFPFEIYIMSSIDLLKILAFLSVFVIGFIMWCIAILAIDTKLFSPVTIPFFWRV